jgi:copper transport protein
MGDPRASFRRAVRFAAGIVILSFMMVGGTTDASAHASLISSDPMDGAVVPAAPPRVTLIFNEPVVPLVIRLIHPDAAIAVLKRFTAHGAVLKVETTGLSARGTYALSWRVVSEDGHPVAGTLFFSVGAPSRERQHILASAAELPVRVANWTLKAALYLGLFFGIGGAVGMTWITTGGRWGAGIAAAAMTQGLVAAVLSVGAQGLDALGLGLPEVVLPTVWQAGLATTYGTTAAIAIAAFAFGLLALAGWGAASAARALSLAALLSVGFALSASGHASAADPQWLMRPAVFLHAVGIAVWAGVLIPLGLALASGTSEGIEALRTFSRLIPVALAPLVAAGVLLAVVQLQSIEALWTTAYGQVLLAKSLLLSALFVLAAINRFQLTAKVEQQDQRATLQLRRSILVEIALIVAVLGVAALWRFTPPPRTLALIAAAPAQVHIHTDKVMADLTLTPGRAGPVTASIRILTDDFRPLEAKEVTLRLSNRAAGIEPITRRAHKTRAGDWKVDAAAIPVPGEWETRIDILISDFELATLEGKVAIRP